MPKEMLFEISPIEDEDSKKKKPTARRKRRQEDETPAVPPEHSAPWRPYVATLDVPCSRCGTSITDLAEVLRDEWHVVCGWGCGRQFVIDPIPGFLDKKSLGTEFVLRSGRFAGQTFDEVCREGNEWYVEELVKLGGKSVMSRAAIEWREKKSIDGPA